MVHDITSFTACGRHDGEVSQTSLQHPGACSNMQHVILEISVSCLTRKAPHIKIRIRRAFNRGLVHHHHHHHHNGPVVDCLSDCMHSLALVAAMGTVSDQIPNTSYHPRILPGDF